MTRPISKSNLTPGQLALLDACGPDAADHPLVLVDKKHLCFSGNAVVEYLRNSGQLNLNRIFKVLDHNTTRDMRNRHDIREFYRMMGYSLCGYLDIFGDQLAEEEEQEVMRKEAEHSR